jgi:hypothetical protein
MRWTSIGSATLLIAAAISLSAPAATAGDDRAVRSFGITASPASVAPGDTVTPPVSAGDEGSNTDEGGEADGSGKAEGSGNTDGSGKAEGSGNTDGSGKAEEGDGAAKPPRADKGVKAGLGGSATGTDPYELVAGGALIVAALCGVLQLCRRAVRDRV